MNKGGSVDYKHRLKHIQKLYSKTLSLHHKGTLKKQGRNLWVGQHPVSKLTALRWNSETENSDSWNWAWFKPDLILYQELDFIHSIWQKTCTFLSNYSHTERPDFKCPLQKKKRALLNHHKIMGKCIVSSTFLWRSFLLNVNLCCNYDSFLLSFSQISISKHMKHLYMCALNLTWLA